MHRLRVTTFGIALPGSSMLAGRVAGEESLDLSYVTADAVAAVVLHPRTLLASREIELLPVEAFIAVSIRGHRRCRSRPSARR